MIINEIISNIFFIRLSLSAKELEDQKGANTFSSTLLKCEGFHWFVGQNANVKTCLGCFEGNEGADVESSCCLNGQKEQKGR